MIITLHVITETSRAHSIRYLRLFLLNTFISFVLFSRTIVQLYRLSSRYFRGWCYSIFSFLYCVLFNFFVIFLLVIVLPVLRFTPFNYPFGIFIWSRGSIIHNYNGYVKWWWSTIYIIILCSNYVISLPGLNEIVLRMYNHQQCADSCWREWTCFTISSKTTIYIYLFNKKIIVDKLLFTCCYCRK